MRGIWKTLNYESKTVHFVNINDSNIDSVIDIDKNKGFKKKIKITFEKSINMNFKDAYFKNYEYLIRDNLKGQYEQN